MIVYGRGNYYKRKSFHRRGLCPNCRRDTYLHTYSTTRCFHLGRLPLFPVAQERVFDHCTVCNTATSQPLKEWNLFRGRELRTALQAMRARPADPGLARHALNLATRLGAREEFLEVAAHIFRQQFDHPELLAELGNSFHFFGMPSEGDEVLRHSLTGHEQPAVRERLAYHEARLPLLPPPANKPILEFLPLAVFPAILLTASVLLYSAAFLGAPRHVFFVNGIGRPYEITVNEANLRLDPGAPVRLPPGARSWRIAPGEDAPPFEPFTEKAPIPLFNRGRDRRIVALNPDRAALLLWEQATYRSPVALASGASAAGNRSFFTGERLYLFEDIDAPFTALPDRLADPPKPDLTSLRGLRQVTFGNPSENAFAILENGQRDTAIEYMRAGLHHHPDNEDFLMLLAALWEPEEALGFLETRLTERPVLVEWHRYYQELSTRYRPGTDIFTRYQGLYDAEPQNRDLAYLLGRLIEKPSEARALLEIAARPPNASPHAFHALAFHHMNRGSFEEALGTAQKALLLLPGKQRFRALEEEMLLATGNHNELIKRRRIAFADDERSRPAAVALAAVLALAGETTEAHMVVQRHLERAGVTTEDESTEALFEATLAENTGDLDTYAKASGRVGWGDWPFYAAVAGGDLIRASEILRERRSVSWREHLLLYTIAEREGFESVALDRLDGAIAMLRESGFRESTIASWFAEGAIAPGLDDVYRLRSWPGDTRILLAALGTRFPRMQSVYFKAARKMNYDPSFPGAILSNLLDEAAASTARRP